MNRSQRATRAFVQKALARTGLTATELARRAGLAPSTLNRFLNSEDVKHTLSARTLMRVAAVAELCEGDAGPSFSGMPGADADESAPAQDIGQILGDLLDDDAPPPTLPGPAIPSAPVPAPALAAPQAAIPASPATRRNAAAGDTSQLREERREFSSRSPLLPTGPRDIPVLGVAVGGADGMFDLNGTAIDQAPRPHTLQGVPNGYAVYMIGDSMEPKYEIGQILYVHPNRPPRVMDHVVVEFTDGRALVKRLIRRDDSKVVLRQYNPPRDLEFAANTVKQIHKIVTADEPR